MKRLLTLLGLLLSLGLIHGCGDDATAPTGDNAPPGSVRDFLATTSVTGDSITLSWTAPGDDGTDGQATEYEIRYLSTVRDPSDWDDAPPLADPPNPVAGGALQDHVITGLKPGTWYFILLAADEVPNWSGYSNVAVAHEADLIPPAAITDLTVSTASAETVTLRWTAPGDDGKSGQARVYQLRRAAEPITPETWGDAVEVAGAPLPASPGAEQAFTVPELEPGTTYYFALRTADEVPNWSALSNSVSGTTPAGGLVRLTTSVRFFGATSPAWSPDGKSIAFFADWFQQFRNQLFVIPAGGGEARWIRTGHDYASSPSWSPNGDRIAFVSERVKGMNPREIYIIGSAPGATPTRVHQQEGKNLTDVAWSPDGTRIAFAPYTTPGSGSGFTSEIYLLDIASGAVEQWSNGGENNRSPAWSPDGTLIAFHSDRSGNFEIWVQPVESGDAVQLTDDPEYDGNPAWSPDGNRIAFSSGRNGDYAIWVMSSTGDNPTRVVGMLDGSGAPTWSPDGNQICFVTWDGNIMDLWVTDLK